MSGIGKAKISGSRQLLDAIAVFRREAAVAAEAAAREADELRAIVRESHALIKRAQQWVTESGVDRSACCVLRAAQSWVVQSKYDDFADKNVLNVSDVAGERTSIDNEWIAFTRNDRRWKFTLEPAHSYLPDDDYRTRYARLTVSIDGEEVIVLRMNGGYDDDGSGWSGWDGNDVIALSVGEWAAELVEMEVVWNAYIRRGIEELNASMAQEEAKRFKL